jgi:hypothetical protein
LVLVAVVVFVSAAGVVALAQPDGGDVFTGCLDGKSGKLDRVAVGFEPAKECKKDIQITWDRAGPAFEGRIAALEERVAELEESFGTLDLFVRCDAGDTIGVALDEARDHPGPVQITILGVCEENVTIDRNDVHFRGVSPESGIAASSDGGVQLRSVRDVSFDNMTISGAWVGVSTMMGSHFTARGLTVRDSGDGFHLFGSSADLQDCTIRDNTYSGLLAWRGSAVSLTDCLVTGNSGGLAAASGTTVAGVSLDITGNGTGVSANAGGTVELSGSTIDQNDMGVDVFENGTGRIHDSRVADNVRDGVWVHTGGVFALGDSVVEDNGGYGINAETASTVTIAGNNAIRLNTNDGIVLRDQSNGAQGLGPVGVTEISGNGGWGLNCAGPPAIAPVQNQFNMASIQFSANGSGGTNCP